MFRYRREYSFFVYILTNPSKSTLYVGFTGNLTNRLRQHYANRGKWKTFGGRYYCYNLVYYEHFTYVNNAIAREKQIKRWRRSKKDKLIESFNPQWYRLNDQFFIPDE